MRTVVAVDPGTEKCGVARVSLDDTSGALVETSKVIQNEDVEGEIASMIEGADAIVVGDGTGSRQIVRRLEAAFPGTGILVVGEAYTSERARQRYWEVHPPSGWRRFVPRGMLVPPNAYDDIAATLLAEAVLLGSTTS